jgi:DNA-binding CsgD family transcriptional regulator
MSPAQVENDTRALREAVSILGEGLGAGVVIMGRAGTIVFATTRAVRLLGGSVAVLPANIAALGDQLDAGESEVELTHTELPGSPHRISIRATRLRGTRHVLLTIAEHAPRAGLTRSLVSRFGLSARSVQLVHLASQGLKNREIGERMGLAEATVKTYLHGIFRDVGVRNRAELVALADRLAIDPTPGRRAQLEPRNLGAT